jgi:hypothetical protein
MKKIFVSVSLLLTAGLSSVFAGNDQNPDRKVLEGFNQEFARAEYVTWSKQDDFDKATFLLGGNRVVAFFNQEGKLEGSAREIDFTQLPLVIMIAVEKRFTNAEIYKVTEISNENGTSYRLELEANNKKYKIKADQDGNTYIIEKLKK